MYHINLSGPKQEVITKLGGVDASDPRVADARSFIGRLLDKSTADHVGVTVQNVDNPDGGSELRVTFAEHGADPRGAKE